MIRLSGFCCVRRLRPHTSSLQQFHGILELKLFNNSRLPHQSLPALLPQSRLLGPFRSSENCPFKFTPDLLVIVAIPWDGCGYVYGDYDHIYQTSSCVILLVRCQGERTRARLRHMDRHRQLECIWSASAPCVLQLQLVFEKESEACKRGL